MACIRAKTAWYACNEEVCGSPVRAAVFGGVWQYAGRPWMATERDRLLACVSAVIDRSQKTHSWVVRAGVRQRGPGTNCQE
eukprot:7391095-Prymnesium_polylepis.1